MPKNISHNSTKHISFWIGLTRAAHGENRWRWEDNNTSQNRNWDPLEPNNAGNVEDCSFMMVTYENGKKKWTWWDALCEPKEDWWSKTEGYFCRLPYTKDLIVESRISCDHKYSIIIRSNLALAIAVIILLLIALPLVGVTLWSNRGHFTMCTQFPPNSISMQQLKDEV